MVGSLLLSLSAFSVYRLNQTQDVTINTASWNWMSEVHLRLDAGAEAMGPQLSEAVIPETRLATLEAPARAGVKLKAKWIVKAKSIIHGKARSATSTARLERRARPPIPKPEAEAILLTKKSEKQPPSHVQAQVQTQAPLEASASEMNILQGLHRQLRGHLILAMTTQPQMDAVLIAQMGPQATKSQVDVAPAAYVPAAVEVAPEPLISHHITYHKKKAHRPKVTLPAAEDAMIAQNDEESVQSPAPASVSAVTTHDETKEQTPAPSDTVPYGGSTYGSQDVIQSTQAAPQAEVISDYSQGLEEKPVAQAEKSGQSESGKILVASGSQSVWLAPSMNQAKGSVSAAPQGRVTTQPPAQPSNPVAVAKPSSPSDPTLVSARTTSHLAAMNTQRVQNVMKANLARDTSNEYSVNAMNTQNSASSSDVTLLTEAFDWVTPVSGGTKSYVSKEAGSQNGAWLLTQASDHWPTLARRASASIPVISRNTGKLLSAMAGASLEAEAGIVFGRLPSGWTVRLSGRSERPIFLNARNQTISPSSVEGERYFAFLNVAPGSHLVYLANRNGVEEGAVGIAAVGGVATYIDLTSIHKVTVTGKVLDGSDVHSRPMAGASVRVLGALATHSETNRSGQFTIDNVLTVGDYPVYVETDLNGAYTHRYQLSPTQLRNTVLYRLSPSAIQTWTNQLEGAISPDSGIVIAAVPKIAASASAHSRLTPVIQSLASNPTLKPEVYTLSSSGQMQVGQSLDAQNVRFVSVQVPEGPAVAKIVDAEKPTDKTLIWSEVIMVSPAVVNIVGPF
jgi:hypothetical protein